ncbi:hypothetical protein ACTOTM_11360 [Bacillus subtilis]|uniref:Uncharacterized protein n=1 Tax=Bacillus subtilis TaxID=1423 RepID=A0AC61YUW5_BACIU|nr:hypothetical protein P5658_13425 [Bacillus subtilis]
MDYQKAFSKILDLLGRFKVGKIDKNLESSLIQFGMDENAITFIDDENVMAFNNTVDYLWVNDKNLYATFTRKRIKKELARLIRCSLHDELSIDSVKELITNLKKEPLQTFEVLYHVLGVEYYSAHPLELGPFTIYNTDIHRNHLLEKYPHSKEILEYELNENENNVMVGVCQAARELDRANQNALVRLRQFYDR